MSEESGNVSPCTLCVQEMLKAPGGYEIGILAGLLVHVHGSNGRDIRVPVLTPYIRHSVLTVLHCLPTGSHLGRKKTYLKVRSQFYWRGMYQDIRLFVKSCSMCQKRNIEK